MKKNLKKITIKKNLKNIDNEKEFKENKISCNFQYNLLDTFG